MSQQTIHLVVPVKVPQGFELKDELPTILKKFIEIGLAEMKEDVEENLGAACSFINEDDQVIATQTRWGQPFCQ